MKSLVGFVLLLAALQAVSAQKCAEQTKTISLDVVGTRGTTPGFPALTLNKGDTITWTNKRDDGPIVVSSTDFPPVFRSEQLNKNESFTYTFNTGGTFEYWLVFEVQTVSRVNVNNCEPFSNSATPSTTPVNSRSPSPLVSPPPPSPTPTLSVTPSRSRAVGSPSPTPSPFDICVNNKPTNEVDIPPGGGVEIFGAIPGFDPAKGGAQVAVDGWIRAAFAPRETEDVRITVTVSGGGAIDFAVATDESEPWAEPICSWSTTNCEYTSQTFTLRCRTPYRVFSAAIPQRRLQWYAFARNRTQKELRVSARFLNVPRQQKKPVTNTIMLENFAGTTPIALQG